MLLLTSALTSIKKKELELQESILQRKEQDKLLGPSGAAQECDCDFITSGQGVIDPRILEEYKNEN